MLFINNQEIAFLNAFAELMNEFEISNVFYNEDHSAISFLGTGIELNIYEYDSTDGVDLAGDDDERA